MRWKQLGAVAPEKLRDARLQLHHAVQIVASAGTTLLAPEPDDSHPNLGFDVGLGALVGRALPGEAGRVGLRLADLTLLRVDDRGVPVDELGLEGSTLEDAYAWLAAALERCGAKLPGQGVVRSAYEIPVHAVRAGAAFSREPADAFAELSRWFANGFAVLEALAARTPSASEVRCWPHHFDVGSLVVVATDAEGALASSVGLGLSPGDDSHDQPYWYVSPWPYPDSGALPPLDRGGSWHTEGFTSAVLTASELLEGPGEGQGDRLNAFLDDAFTKSRGIVAP